MSDPRSARMEQDCQHLAVENSRLAARLAEVEAERDGVAMQNDLAAARLREMAADLVKNQAERDRLAQELEDALGHLRAVLDAWDPMAENYEMGPFFEAREFLARFPVKEGDGNG